MEGFLADLFIKISVGIGEKYFNNGTLLCTMSLCNIKESRYYILDDITVPPTNYHQLLEQVNSAFVPTVLREGGWASLEELRSEKEADAEREMRKDRREIERAFGLERGMVGESTTVQKERKGEIELRYKGIVVFRKGQDEGLISPGIRYPTETRIEYIFPPDGVIMPDRDFTSYVQQCAQALDQYVPDRNEQVPQAHFKTEDPTLIERLESFAFTLTMGLNPDPLDSRLSIYDIWLNIILRNQGTVIGACGQGNTVIPAIEVEVQQHSDRSTRFARRVVKQLGALVSEQYKTICVGEESSAQRYHKNA